MENETVKKEFILSWGIHRGTIMSRDIGESYYFATEKECIDKANELQVHFNSMGYKIWYAKVIHPNGEEKDIIYNHYF